MRQLVYQYTPQKLRNFWDLIDASAVGSRLAQGAFWSVFGALISRGLMLLASILVARILGRDVYGEYGMIRSTVMMFSVFAGFGLGMTATKHVAELRTVDPDRAGRIIAISGLFATLTGGIVAIGVLCGAQWIATKTINAPHLVYELRIAAPILFLSALNGAQTGALAGFEAFRTITRVNVWVGLTSFPLMLCGAYFGGLRGSIWALAFNICINWMLNHVALRRECKKFNVPFKIKSCAGEWKTLVHFSLPAALSGFMVSPVTWACNVMLVNNPGGYGQLAIFDAANQWRMAILFIPASVSQIVLPMLASLRHENDNSQYRKILKFNLYINAGAALAVAVPVAVISPWIMKSYGADFADGSLVVVIMAGTTVVSAVNHVVGQAFASTGKMWLGLVFNSLWAISLIILSFFSVQGGYGAVGLAYANLLAYLMHSLWQGIYVFKKR